VATRDLNQPLFADDDQAPVAIATTVEESPDLIAARAVIAERDAQIAAYQAAVAAQPIQIGELEHVEDNVATELRARVIQPILDAELKKQAAVYDARIAKLEGRFETQSLTEAQRVENGKKRALATLNEAIFAAHPDFSEVSNSDWYIRSLSQTIPLTTRTFGEEIRAAYKAGNVEQFNRLVSHVKSNYAGSSTPAMVFGSNGMPDLSPVVAEAAPVAITRAEMEAVRTDFQRGRVSRKEYVEKVRQYEAQP
jgi:hypothetical protein